MALTYSERHDRCAGHLKIEGEEASSVIDVIGAWPYRPDYYLISLRVTNRSSLTPGLKPCVTVYIEIEFNEAGDPKPLRREFIHKITDMLRRRFGNGLISWSLETPVYVAAEV